MRKGVGKGVVIGTGEEGVVVGWRPTRSTWREREREIDSHSPSCSQIHYVTGAVLQVPILPPASECWQVCITMFSSESILEGDPVLPEPATYGICSLWLHPLSCK